MLSSAFQSHVARLLLCTQRRVLNAADVLYIYDVYSRISAACSTWQCVHATSPAGCVYSHTVSVCCMAIWLYA